MQPVPQTAGEEPEDVVRRDIVYLKDPPGTWHRQPARPWFAGPLFLALQCVPPAGACLCLVLVRRRQALRGDVARSRRLRAPRAARTGLESARLALRRRDNTAFYEAVWDTLATYFGDRLNLAPGEVTEARVGEAMRREGVGDHTLSQLRDLFMVCEHARFGLNSGDNGKMSDSERHNADVVMGILEGLIRATEKAEGGR